MTIKFQVGRVTVELDADEPFTPVMLGIGKHHATWECVMGTGHVDDEKLTPDEIKALEAMEPEIEVFYNAVKEAAA